MTRLWHIASRGKDAAGLDREVARADAPQAAPAANGEAADAVRPVETAIAVTVVPGFNSPAPNVWIRNDGASEVADLVITHAPTSGEPTVLEAPSQRLLPGEACVVALGESADGDVIVKGTVRHEGKEPLAVEAVASVPPAAAPPEAVGPEAGPAPASPADAHDEAEGADTPG